VVKSAVPDPDQLRRPSTLWRHREFLLLWGGQTLSEVGAQVTALALPLAALVLLHCTTVQAALLAAGQYAACLLFALPAGAVARAVGKRRLMGWCDALRAGLVGSVPAAHACGVLSLGQLYAVAVAVSTLSVLHAVAYHSYLPVLLGRGRLLEGNGKLGAGRSFAEAAGPGLGTALVGALGAAGAMAADALSYLVSAALLVGIRTREPHAAPAPRAQARRGLSYLLADPLMRAGVGRCAAANFCFAAIEALAPVFLVRTVGVGAAGVGLLLGAGAVGGAVGGLAAAGLGRRYGSARMTWMPMAVLSVPGLLIPAAGPGARLALFACGWAALSFAAAVCGVGLLTYRQVRCPPDLLPAVNAAARWLTWGALPLGAAAGGLLAGATGARAALWCAAVGHCVAGAWFYFSPFRALRDLPAGPRTTGASAATAAMAASQSPVKGTARSST
jgi:hypothetical protein